ncbi:bactofilin family protein [Aurantiacibacter aquimixticola]|uniref:bactofilin family protein n=1 Tax=Aurantiacibacter aquimixticola TaxID=1958945 RepID=UPI001F5B7FD6|nr:polymer-forming cytoskeletal protein [Aurantiacibacter aquimixticola]
MAKNGNSTFSVIGPDVTIRGNIEATVDLHVDGKVVGDIACASLVQGESSRVEGEIKAESARLSGEVSGKIEARELVVLRSARIEGDVSYETLTIEQGANVDGRFAPLGNNRRSSDKPAAQQQPQQTPAKDVKKGDGEPSLSLAG